MSLGQAPWLEIQQQLGFDAHGGLAQRPVGASTRLFGSKILCQNGFRQNWMRSDSSISGFEPPWGPKQDSTRVFGTKFLCQNGSRQIGCVLTHLFLVWSLLGTPSKTASAVVCLPLP